MAKLLRPVAVFHPYPNNGHRIFSCSTIVGAKDPLRDTIALNRRKAFQQRGFHNHYPVSSHKAVYRFPNKRCWQCNSRFLPHLYGLCQLQQQPVAELSCIRILQCE